MRKLVAVLFVFATTFATAAAAQTDDASTRRVGRKGAVQLSLSFTTLTSIETDAAGQATTNGTTMYGLIDVGRFVTDKFLTRFGVSGSGSVGRQGAAGDISFTLLTGALYYFTPDKTSSLYLGGDSALPISQAGTGDMMVNGRLGVQSAIRHNASFFVEGGYGATLTSLSSSGSLMSNLGVRILF